MPDRAKTYFITTAIDYTNGPPHIGHAYEKILADAAARARRLLGQNVFFLTGVDQHGQKVQQTAAKEGKSPEQFVGEITPHFIQLWDQLNVQYDGWAATTDERHKRVVQALLQQLFDAGQIYKDVRRGWYSLRQEQFLTDKERNEQGQFGPEWGQVEEREEENYYFRLSDHTAWLREFLEKNPGAVYPPSRLTQLKRAVEDGKGLDLCISRPKSRLTWGIELPFDKDYVTFVWFDALTNYISFAGHGKAAGDTSLPDFDALWPCDAHVIGKDILIPAHGIYWYIILHAIGFRDDQMPKLLVHGWWNLVNKSGEEEKISKSLGNVRNPYEMAQTIGVGVDGLRYYLLSDIATGGDGELSDERILVRYNKDLADIFGNLLNRTLNMARKYLGGIVPEQTHDEEGAAALRSAVASLPGIFCSELEEWQFHKIINAVRDVLTQANTFIEQTQPFKLAKDPANAARVATILGHLAEVVLHASILLSPIIPAAAEKIQQQLGWTMPKGFTLAELRWGMLKPGHVLGEPSPVFPKPLPPA